MTTIIEVDSRRRVSLGELATAERYLVERDDEGVITLSPAVVITELEARLLNRPDILAQVAKSRAGVMSTEAPQRRKK